jgi:phosphoribosylamine--glycine ligase
VIATPLVQDHKRRFEGDKGPNTGGMGSYSLPDHSMPFLKPQDLEDGLEITRQVAAALLKETGSPYKGVMYGGFIATKNGVKLLEYNARFGDPETQAILLRLESDLVDALEACVDGSLDKTELRWSPGASACVVASSAGYPGSYKTGFPITGLAAAAQVPGVQIFHSGSSQAGGQLLTAGGRVLGVTAAAPSLEEALGRAYQAMDKIHFDGIYFRRDIGHRALRRKP